MYGMTPDEWDSYNLLRLAESGRPEEQMAQFVASMIECGGLQTNEVLRFLGEVICRVEALLDENDASGSIWTNLLPGGNQRPLQGPAEILEDISTMFRDREWNGDFCQEVADKLVAHSILEISDKDREHVVLLGKHKDCDLGDCWMVMDINNGRIGWWNHPIYRPLAVTSDDLQPNDVIEVDEVDWIDSQATVAEARNRIS